MFFFLDLVKKRLQKSAFNPRFLQSQDFSLTPQIKNEIDEIQRGVSAADHIPFSFFRGSYHTPAQIIPASKGKQLMPFLSNYIFSRILPRAAYPQNAKNPLTAHAPKLT